MRHALILTSKNHGFIEYLQFFKTFAEAQHEIKHNHDVWMIVSSGLCLASIEKISKDGFLELVCAFDERGTEIAANEDEYNATSCFGEY